MQQMEVSYQVGGKCITILSGISFISLLISFKRWLVHGQRSDGNFQRPSKRRSRIIIETHHGSLLDAHQLKIESTRFQIC
ncbi:uncharacterized protein FA14DRAFT_159551 [Meira miltonrushii]|uniref:Uncharacterized protein n=1 Tax=Meira miltonrushii TaxID=1280837 RepID=A0A316VIP8_9BASI|nr:uncharacterized protein FA14DRAFT_159551 [Meira miltonrushii]PWN37537.1 hypothetical protein FA14DRAFT_159551 [Meira miltonrushii]